MYIYTMEYLTYKYKMYSLCDRNKYLHYEIDAFAEVYNHFIALHKRYYQRYGKYPSKFTMINHSERESRIASKNIPLLRVWS